MNILSMGLNLEFCMSRVASLTLCYIHKTVQSHGIPENLKPHIAIFVFVTERITSKEQVPHTSGEIL